MKSIFNKHVLIAVTVIISLCLLYWGIEYLKGINLFKPANFYYANFEKVDGLNISAPVTINGETMTTNFILLQEQAAGGGFQVGLGLGLPQCSRRK